MKSSPPLFLSIILLRGPQDRSSKGYRRMEGGGYLCTCQGGVQRGNKKGRRVPTPLTVVVVVVVVVVWIT